MNKGVSIHVVDVAHGVVARGMRVQMRRMNGANPGELLAEGLVGANGVVSQLDALDAQFNPGLYEVVLHVAEYFRARGTPLADPPFMDVQVFRFGLSDPSQHYHLPIKLTPWGMSVFRGA